MRKKNLAILDLSSLAVRIFKGRLSMKRLLVWIQLFAGFLLLTPQQIPGNRPALASPEATWPQITFEPAGSGLQAPVHLAHAGDGSGRLFVVEQAGRIRIIKNGSLSGTPFLDISGRVRSPFSQGDSEEGLLSVAFPPGYGSSKDHFYVYYTNKNSDNQVSRFRVGANPDSADPSSEELILEIPHPKYFNHNGGQLAFGPDGYLYVGTGDGGSGGDPDGNAQNPASLLGKILRLEVENGAVPPTNGAYRLLLPLVFRAGDGAQSSLAYRIPADNPFVGQLGYREEIWALGLRNPWRFSFDRQTGDLYIGDVGQGSWEEIDFQLAASAGGENYGWDIVEGLVCFGAASCDQNGLTQPVHVYRTHSGGTCSVTGGFVYRGASFPALQGIYLFGDYCNGKIWGLQREAGGWVSQELEDTNYSITSFGEDQDGELYVVNAGGAVYRIVANSSQ
jgi:glucose/arabinose dehydrogenase